MKKMSMLVLLGVGLVGCSPAAAPAPSNPPAAAPAEVAPATPADAAAPATPPADAAAAPAAESK